MTHTQGPWGVDGPTHGPGRFKWVLAPSKGGKYILIAEVSPTGNDASHPTGNDRDANASLISAAPNLLAALKALERRAFDAAVNSIPEAHVTLRQELDTLCFEARAAIAKAQGGTND